MCMHTHMSPDICVCLDVHRCITYVYAYTHYTRQIFWKRHTQRDNGAPHTRFAQLARVVERQRDPARPVYVHICMCIHMIIYAHTYIKIYICTYA